MKNKKRKIILISLIILLVAIILYFFLIKPYKTIKIGNTISKSTEEIKNYILNISSYEVTAEITVYSNKNQNQYVVKQKYEEEENTFKQEVLEPENIKGLTTIYDGKQLTIQNTNLELSHVYENYPFIGDNTLDLCSFVEDLKNSNQPICMEEENEIRLEVQKEKMTKILVVNKETSMPSEMVIQDINKNILVYIKYKEIELNETKKEEVLAQNAKKDDSRGICSLLCI